MLLYSAIILLLQGASLVRAATSSTTSATTTSTTSTTKVCTPTSTFLSGRTCTTKCGMDRPGGDYNHRYFNSFGECVQACAADPTCLTAQYHEGNRYCYFKNVQNALVANTDVDTVDCTAPCKSGNDTLSGKTCTVTCGQDRPGGDYARYQVASSFDCATACAADSACVSAQFSETTGFCYFKNQVTIATSSSTVDSAVCYPSNPNYCNGANFQNDNQNCGGCGTRCGDNQYCSNAVCIPRWNLCTNRNQWSRCGQSGSCYCWPTREGDNVCLPSSIEDDNQCNTSRDCKAGTSCWGPSGVPGYLWGFCVDPNNYVAQCKVSGSTSPNPSRKLARNDLASLVVGGRGKKRDASGVQNAAVLNYPNITITETSGKTYNITWSS